MSKANNKWQVDRFKERLGETLRPLYTRLEDRIAVLIDEIPKPKYLGINEVVEELLAMSPPKVRARARKAVKRTNRNVGYKPGFTSWGAATNVAIYEEREEAEVDLFEFTGVQATNDKLRKRYQKEIDKVKKYSWPAKELARVKEWESQQIDQVTFKGAWDAEAALEEASKFVANNA
jgi:hypothetical protein